MNAVLSGQEVMIGAGTHPGFVRKCGRPDFVLRPARTRNLWRDVTCVLPFSERRAYIWVRADNGALQFIDAILRIRQNASVHDLVSRNTCPSPANTRHWFCGRLKMSGPKNDSITILAI